MASRGAARDLSSTSPTAIRSRRVVLERMLAGVSTRRYRRTQEPVGEQVEVEGAVDVEVGGVADVRGAHPRGARQADGAASSRICAWR